jgi:hypothetical protein
MSLLRMGMFWCMECPVAEFGLPNLCAAIIIPEVKWMIAMGHCHSCGHQFGHTIRTPDDRMVHRSMVD